MTKRLLTVDEYYARQSKTVKAAKSLSGYAPVMAGGTCPPDAPKRAKSTLRKPQAPIPTESDDQKRLISWFEDYGLSVGVDPRLLMASGNGAMLAGDARLRAIRMKILKAMGLRVGTPDLLLAVPKWAGAPYERHLPVFFGLFIELKREKGGIVSDDQHEMLYLLRSRGYNCVVCEGYLAAKRAIEVYLE